MVHSGKIFDAYFAGMTLGFVTIGMNKCYHRVEKYHVNGTRPHNDLHESAKRLSYIKEKQERQQSRNVAFDATETWGKRTDRDANVKEFSDYCKKKTLSKYG